MFMYRPCGDLWLAWGASMRTEIAAFIVGVGWSLLVLVIGVTMGWRMKGGIDPLPSLGSIRIGMGNKEPMPEEKRPAKEQEKP